MARCHLLSNFIFCITNMPVHRGRDSKGSYYQWGSQKKYYYTANVAVSRRNAKAQAERQGRVIILRQRHS